MKLAGKVLYWVSAVCLFLFGLFVRYCLIGYTFSAQVCFFLSLVLAAFGVLHLLVKRFGKPIRIVRLIFTILLCIGFSVLAVTEGFIIHASFGDPDEQCDYVVVLGCMVRQNGPSPTLQNRIDAAYNYLIAHPDVIAIVSGGKGADEPMSEAQCMYENLLAMGIPEERIWVEDQATSTWGNLVFSLDLIEEKTGTRPTSLGVISSEYHLFRAGLLAREAGVEAVGIPARSTVIPQAINHFMREIAGVWHYILLGGRYD